jgi:hypothetical protein
LNEGVRPSVEDDAALLAPSLRQADVEEIEAASGMSPLDALRKGYETSLQPLTAVWRGRPIAMFGCVRETPDIGRIWMLGSDGVVKAKSRFIRESRPWFRHISLPFKGVTNIVDMRNSVHIRWLRWCGVRFVGIVKTEGGLPFLEFFWRVR